MPPEVTDATVLVASIGVLFFGVTEWWSGRPLLYPRWRRARGETPASIRWRGAGRAAVGVALGVDAMPILFPQGPLSGLAIAFTAFCVAVLLLCNARADRLRVRQLPVS